LQSLLWMLASHHYANTVDSPKSVSQKPASKALAQARFMPAIPHHALLPPPTVAQATAHSRKSNAKHTMASAFSVQTVSPVLHIVINYKGPRS